MNIKISAVADYSTTFLQKNTIAQIHSIFSKAINLEIANQIVALQPKDAYLSPLSLLTCATDDEFSQLIQQFDLLKNKSFAISFDLQDCNIYCSTLDETDCYKQAFKQYKKSSELILCRSNKNGMRNLLIEKKADDFIFDAINNILHLATKCFVVNDVEKAAETLAKLIGLGIGLTPSGDDFICGILAVLHKMGLKHSTFFQHLSQQIEQKLTQTNRISAAFLQCSVQNHFSQPVIQFFNIQNQQNLTVLSTLFNDIGHSSGMDTLCGIYFMLNLLTKNPTCFK